MPVPLNETTIFNETQIPDIPGAIMSTCGAWCWIYIVLSSFLAGFHVWMMIGPLHAWAKGNFSLISLSVWSLGSFALSMMYVLKVKSFFLMPRWIRIFTWVLEMIYSLYFFCAAVVTTVSWVKGKAMEDTNIEIVLAYLMVLGSPAAVWGTVITFIEGLSGDMSSEEAKEAAEIRKKHYEDRARHKKDQKERAKEIAEKKEKEKADREAAEKEESEKDEDDEIEEEETEKKSDNLRDVRNKIKKILGEDDHDYQSHGES